MESRRGWNRPFSRCLVRTILFPKLLEGNVPAPEALGHIQFAIFTTRLGVRDRFRCRCPWRVLRGCCGPVHSPQSQVAFGQHRQNPEMNRAAIFILLPLLAVLAVLMCGVYYVWGFGWKGGPRILTRALAQDGTELCVIQTANPQFSEPFTTSVYYRKPGTTWGWFYYDHQDVYWARARTEVDPVAKRMTVYRGGKPTVTFDWKSEIYRKWDGKRVTRVFTNAQTQLPAWWTPPTN
jgi:hypothetical protein